MGKNVRIWAALLMITASAVVFSGCGAGKEASASGNEIPSVKVMTLQSLTAQGARGKIAANETVQIVSKLAGKVERVNVQEGFTVKKGDVLVQLETDDLLQQVNQAQAGVAAAKAKLSDAVTGARMQEIEAAQSAVDQALSAVRSADAVVEQAKAALDYVRRNYNRTRNGYDTGLATKDDLDKMELEYEKAKTGYEQAVAQQKAMQAQLSAAESKLSLLKAGATPGTIEALKADVSRNEAALQLAENALKNAAIRSPINGVVIRKNVNPGEMAQPGMPLITVVNMDEVKVEVSVPEDQVNLIQEGSAAEIKVTNVPGKSFQGIVSFVSPVSDPNSNTFPVKLTVKNPDRLLRAGSVAEVSFAGGERTSLELPKSALVHKDNKTYVFKFDNGVVHQVAVETSEKNDDWVYVKQGASLKNNDRIVVNSDDRLADGAKVRAE